MPDLPDPVLRFAFEARVEIGADVPVGGPSERERLVFVPITGGTVAGPRLTGTILPGGGDWYTDRDGVASLDARYLIRTDDGDVVDISNRGFWRASPEVTARLDAGQEVAESEYYYRTSARFTSGAPALAWLTQSIVVGLARQDGATICIRFFTLD